ncbi:unnamed protein product [Protopolystoma xenopodis]|uniref:Uncharacterized protein n=1 Tax=Protopolystoma xenopodis TaxID=117903 RepID=A0A3S5B0P5_9PLAT|nr:unnamed protein product [Protopolystoma xenopodis]
MVTANELTSTRYSPVDSCSFKYCPKFDYDGFTKVASVTPLDEASSLCETSQQNVLSGFASASSANLFSTTTTCATITSLHRTPAHLDPLTASTEEPMEISSTYSVQSYAEKELENISRADQTFMVDPIKSADSMNSNRFTYINDSKKDSNINESICLSKRNIQATFSSLSPEGAITGSSSMADITGSNLILPSINLTSLPLPSIPVNEKGLGSHSGCLSSDSSHFAFFGRQNNSAHELSPKPKAGSDVDTKLVQMVSLHLGLEKKEDEEDSDIRDSHTEEEDTDTEESHENRDGHLGSGWNLRGKEGDPLPGQLRSAMLARLSNDGLVCPFLALIVFLVVLITNHFTNFIKVEVIGNSGNVTSEYTRNAGLISLEANRDLVGSPPVDPLLLNQSVHWFLIFTIVWGLSLHSLWPQLRRPLTP